MNYSDRVRCGSLAAVERQHDPRVCLGGAAWSQVAPQPTDCPAKGQPLLSTSGGFSLGAGVLMKTEPHGLGVAPESHGSRSDTGEDRKSVFFKASASDRTPRVSSGPESAARRAKDGERLSAS